MLLTDSPAIGVEDLADHETVILDTAHTEGINLTVKIVLAINEVGLQLLSRFPQLGLVNIGLKNVVVTPALRLWLIFHTLEIVYRDAYHNQLNDRYKAKWNEYRDLSLFASGLLFQIGIGTVVDPIPQATHPIFNLVAGGLTPAKYFVEVAWLNSSGAKGAPSEMTGIEVTSGATLRVTAVNGPANGVSWNIYVGTTPDTLSLQNDVPITAGQSWTAPFIDLLPGGAAPGEGQEPIFLSPAPRVLLRG